MTLLVGLAIRSSVVLAAGLLLNACLGKRSAALRHRVLVLTVLAAALVVPLSMALPVDRSDRTPSDSIYPGNHLC
jgi:hypothetical protein